MRGPYVPAVAALALLAGCGGSGGPTGGTPVTSPPPVSNARDPMFETTRLHEVRIEIDPADWASLRNVFFSNQYYAANITIDGELVQQVGIRSRGNATRNEVKPGLRVDFNRNIKTQEFHGYKTLVLDNHWTDVSFMREKLAFAVFEAMGIPAPQVAYARFTVNGEYWGVYSLVEPVSKPFLKARLGEESGNLFDYEWIDYWLFTPRGPGVEAYIPLPFDPETNEEKLDGSGLVEFVEVINEAPDGTFQRDVGALLDLNKFLAYVAAENALAERDGFVGQQGVNNFFLYQYGNRPGFTFIPWDKDTCLFEGQWPAMQRMGDNILTARLMNDPAMQASYLASLRRAAGFVSESYLGPQISAAHSLIRDSVLADDKKPFTNEEFEQGVSGLRGVVAERSRDILAQLGASQAALARR